MTDEHTALRRLVYAYNPYRPGVPAWLALLGDGPAAQYKCVYCYGVAVGWPSPGKTIMTNHTTGCAVMDAFTALGVLPESEVPR